jgi:hypothetical protein
LLNDLLTDDRRIEGTAGNQIALNLVADNRSATFGVDIRLRAEVL